MNEPTIKYDGLIPSWAGDKWSLDILNGKVYLTSPEFLDQVLNEKTKRFEPVGIQ